MKILVACEESQTVTKEFRKLGHEAFSCDIIDCSGGHPEWHIKDDALKVAYSQKWDMMIVHPPCTYLSVSGLHWNERIEGRAEKTEEALRFVRALMNASIDRIAIENPISCISSRIRKPDQIIQPYEFGHNASKKTCLWLKSLPLLIKDTSDYISPRIVNNKPRWDNQTDSGQNKLAPSAIRAKLRSKTYTGIANAIAKQWGVLKKNEK